MTDLDGAEALAEFDITESDQMVRVLRTQVDVVLPEGTAVLNAADMRVAGLAPLCDGDVILYSVDPQAEALAEHQSAGGKAVLVRQDRVVLANGSSESFLPGLGRLTIWRATHAGVGLESLLAAVAAAWAHGHSAEPDRRRRRSLRSRPAGGAGLAAAVPEPCFSPEHQLA